MLNAFAQLATYGVTFQSASESFNTGEISGRLLVTFLAGIAQAERETTRERTMSGKIKAAREGKFVCGVPTYGYYIDKVTRRLVPIPEQAKIIRKLFSWVVDSKLPLKEVERRMNQLKIPAPYNAKYKKKVTLNYWHKRSITRILCNETYTGTFYYRKYKRPFNNLTSITEKRMLRPREEWIEQSAPAIISREMFEASKKQLLKNREMSKRNQKRSYLYCKIIFCSKCGYRIFGGFQPNTKKWPSAGGRYYHGTYRNDKPPGVSKRCEWCPTYAESRLEPIWECLKDILKNPKNMFDPLEKYLYREESPTNINERLEQITTELSSVLEKKHRVDELYIAGNIDQNKYREHSNENNAEEKRLTDEATRLRQTLLTKKEKSEREVAIRQAYERVKDSLDSISYEKKSAVIRLFIERITLYAKENYASVVFKFPSSTDTANVRAGTPVSQEDKSFPLVLNIKTKTQNERRAEILRNNPLMFHVPKMLV
jgi:site-specific DNA recombinase